MKRISAALIILFGLATAALAQTVTGPIPNAGAYGAYNAAPPTCANGSGCWFQTDANGNLKVTGSFSSTIAGFAPTPAYASLTASGSSASVALPAGAVVAFQNTGTTTVSCTLGVGSATATAGMVQVPPSSTIFLTVGANTFGACIDETGSVSNVVRLAGGSGLGTGFGGGGGSGGGGGGAVTVADGADVTQGAIADPAVAAGATGSSSAKLRRLTTDIGAVLAQLQGVTAGADNVSNTATGSLTYARMQVFDGSTWDRWTGLVQAAQSGTWTMQPGNTANTTPWLMSISQGGNTALVKAANTVGTSDQALVVAVANTLAAVANNADNVAAAAAAASPVVNYNYAFDGTTWDRVRAVVVDPCEANAQTYAPISITTATTTRIVAPSASNKTYICHLFLTSAAADNVGIVEGTGGTCGTGTAGVIGGTTAANGPNFAANGGVALHAGGKVAVAQTAGTNVDLCLITSAATPLAGGIKYVQAP